MVVLFFRPSSSSGNAQNNSGDDDADGDDFDDDSVKRRSETNEKGGNAFIKEETEETNEVLNSFEERLELAIEEAREILTEATKRARDETRRELLKHSAKLFILLLLLLKRRKQKFFKARKENDENKITDENRALNIARTQSFLEIKFKMRDFEAPRVAKNLALSKSVYEDCDDLMVQVDRLEKALPDVNVGKLLQNDASIVSSVNVAKAVQNMMTLYELGFKHDLACRRCWRSVRDFYWTRRTCPRETGYDSSRRESNRFSRTKPTRGVYTPSAKSRTCCGRWRI